MSLKVYGGKVPAIRKLFPWWSKYWNLHSWEKFDVKLKCWNCYVEHLISYNYTVYLRTMDVILSAWFWIIWAKIPTGCLIGCHLWVGWKYNGTCTNYCRFGWHLHFLPCDLHIVFAIVSHPLKPFILSINPSSQSNHPLNQPILSICLIFGHPIYLFWIHLSISNYSWHDRYGRVWIIFMHLILSISLFLIYLSI